MSDAAALPATVAAYVRRQTMISIVISAVFSAGFFLLVFGTRGPVGVWQPDYLALDFLPQSAIASFMAALVPGLQTRGAILSGALPGTAPTVRATAVQALSLALIGLAMAGAVIAALSISGLAAFAWSTAFAIKVAYGSVLGAIITPLAVRAALTKG